MSQSWREVLDEFDVEATATSPPGDREGDWFQLLAVFGTAGFLRLTTDGEMLVMELAPPAGTGDFSDPVEGAGWSELDVGPPAVFERSFPGADDFRDLWVSLARLGDTIRDDDADEFLEELKSGSAESGSEKREEDSAGHGEDSSLEDVDSEPFEERSVSPFEPIGGKDDREPLPDGEFGWISERRGEGVDTVLGFGTVLEPDEYRRLEDRLISNLRGKYDVDAEIDSDHEIKLRLLRDPGTRVALHVTPDRGVSRATAEDVEENLREYLGTLADLSSSGIDPLVFLGVTTSKRAPRPEASASAFESIGDEEPPAGTSTRDRPSRNEWVVDDEEPEEDEGTGVVLAVESEPEPDDPLEAGRFDDPRLKGPDATTSLVDVVLRHPGYSDRRIGQVLSILLSIEYSGSLELINKAPTVIAWGVSRERAQTMKTVIEGAGGKVHLSEPGQFHED